MSQLKQLPPLSLYIHMPWCVKKCPYCDFNSHNLNGELPENEYINALIRDLEIALPQIWGRSIQTIFIGGGTPSLFGPQAINKLLAAIRSLTNLSPFAEITMEANPGTIDSSYLAEYSKIGINRISLGVQSFDDKYLKVLGRIHDSKQAIHAIGLAKQYFKKLNIDLMYGLPGQSIHEAIKDVKTAIEFAPQHLSCYNLTIEKNTEFFVKPPANMPDNDLCYEMEDTIIGNLHEAGFNRYEVSAYARDGYECQHNINYWQFGDYLGIGAGAHSKISFHDKIIRQVRQKRPQDYIKALEKSEINQTLHIIENKNIKDDELPFEFMLNALRLKDGFSTTLFVERTGLSLNAILSKLNLAQQKKLLDLKLGQIVPTKDGYNFLNDLITMFL